MREELLSGRSKSFRFVNGVKFVAEVSHEPKRFQSVVVEMKEIRVNVNWKNKNRLHIDEVEFYWLKINKMNELNHLMNHSLFFIRF